MSTPYPYSIETDNRSASVVMIETLGKGGVAMVLAMGLLGVVLGSLAIGIAGRAMDRASIAEREARIAQDKYTYTMGELAKKGIIISTDGH